MNLSFLILRLCSHRSNLTSGRKQRSLQRFEPRKMVFQMCVGMGEKFAMIFSPVHDLGTKVDDGFTVIGFYKCFMQFMPFPGPLNPSFLLQ